MWVKIAFPWEKAHNHSKHTCINKNKKCTFLSCRYDNKCHKCNILCSHLYELGFIIIHILCMRELTFIEVKLFINFTKPTINRAGICTQVHSPWNSWSQPHKTQSLLTFDTVDRPWSGVHDSCPLVFTPGVIPSPWLWQDLWLAPRQ